MDRLIYTSLAAMRQAMTAQATSANNIANSSTPGFRSDQARFATAYISQKTTQARAVGRELPSFTLMQAGTATATGRMLDIAARDHTWVSIQDAQGRIAYTRRGDLHVDDKGLLRTGDGLAVLGDNGPIIIPPNSQIAITDDGTIQTIAADGARADVARIRLVQALPGTLVKRQDGLFIPASGQNLTADPNARITAGHLETSNVDMGSTMVELLMHARAYEFHTRMIATTRDMDDKSAALMRIDN